MSCGVGRRCRLDPTLLWLWLLWLWRRLVATAPIGPLAWELPCAMGSTLEKAKRQKNYYYDCTRLAIWITNLSLYSVIWRDQRTSDDLRYLEKSWGSSLISCKSWRYRIYLKCKVALWLYPIRTCLFNITVAYVIKFWPWQHFQV